MEYCAFSDLAEHINERKQEKNLYEEEDVMNIFIQILNAIKFIHSKDITHFDLKPQNIFLS